MKHLLWIPVCMVALAVPTVVLAGGGEGGFDDVVRSIESRYHQQAMRIPFSGLISLVARGTTHNGVGNLHIAEFEHFDADVDGNDLNQLVEQKIGAGWQRIIRDTSRHGSEQTLIFMRPEGKRMGVFVVDLDGKEMNVVQVSVDPDHLNETIGKYDHHDHDVDSDTDPD
ncbi:MAG TPA: hypothetical protein VG844_09200 [Terracidiphilus sp.]|nr:hypothetical protein [Terracidiphilus sp.]